MSRRRESSNPVALFPFLAVLMSAMGALILLLLVISNKVQSQKEMAFRAAVSKEPPPLPKLPDKIKLDPLAPLPDYKPEKEIKQKLPELPPLVDKRKDAKKKLDELKKQHAKLDAEASKKPEDDLGLSEVARAVAAMKVKLQELKVLRQKALEEAEAKKREIDKLKGEKRQIDWDEQHVENKYAIVPYTGSNGTRRRPIFLECTGSAITLQPEGVAITAEILQKPSDPRNPLAEMCRAIMQEMTIDGPEGVPYPLLIVRPDGTSAYYGAQLALSDLNLPFGYELISEDMKLEFPEPNPKIKAVAEAAIEKALKQREKPWQSYAYGSMGGGMGGPGDEGDDPQGSGPGGKGNGAGGSDGQAKNGAQGRGQGNSRSYEQNGPQPGGPELGLLARRYAEQLHAGPAARMRQGQGLQPHNRYPGGTGNGYGGNGYGSNNGGRAGHGGHAGGGSSDIPPPPSYVHNGQGGGSGGGSGGGQSLLGVGNFGQGGGPIIPGVNVAENGGSGNGAGGGNGANESGAKDAANNGSGNGRGARGSQEQGLPAGYGQDGYGSGGRGQGMAGGNPQGGAGGGQPGMSAESGWGQSGPGRNGQAGAGGSGAVGRPGSSGGDGWSGESGDGTGESGLASGSQGGTPGEFGGASGGSSESNQSGQGFAGMNGRQAGSSSPSGQPSNGYQGAGQGSGMEGGAADGAPGMANDGSSGSSGGMGGPPSGAQQPGQNSPISISMGSPNGSASDRKVTFDDVMQQGNGRQQKLPAEHDPDLFELNNAMDGSGRGEVSVPGLRINRQPVRREVVVECRQFGLILHPGKVFVPLITDNDLRTAASAIYRHAANQLRGAGSPGPLHRWNPVIAVYVRPDGVENYYRTRMALLNSELDMIRKNVDWETPLEFPERFASRPNEASANQPSRNMSR